MKRSYNLSASSKSSGRAVVNELDGKTTLRRHNARTIPQIDSILRVRMVCLFLSLKNGPIGAGKRTLPSPALSFLAVSEENLSNLLGWILASMQKDRGSWEFSP